MNFNLDIVIVAIFLIINLLAGLLHASGIKNLKNYAIGKRNFSTATLAATIISTWVTGSALSITIFETYQRGLHYLLMSGLSGAISFLIIADLYAPRMKEFFGSLSVAEAMGNLFGKHVRTITAISGIFPAIGSIAMQFAVLAALLEHGFGVSGIYTICISSIVVITYSSFGGIKSVTFTDVIQFLTFGIVTPIIALLIWKSSGHHVLECLLKNSFANYQNLINYNDPNFINTLCIFLFFLIPGLDPAIFQRILMAKNTLQISRTFTIAAVFFFLCISTFSFIGILLRANSLDLPLNSNNIIGYILDTYLYTGFKGILIIGVMAMLMSTADSYINAAAVLFTNDICHSFNINLTEKKSLMLVRFASFLIGIGSLFLSLTCKNLLFLLLTAYGFYMPIVTVPLTLAIFGFRSSSKSVLLGMLAGFVTVCYFKFFSKLDSLMPGIAANLVVLMASHYLLKQPGGWVGIKESSPLDALRFERQRKLHYIFYSIRNFNLIEFCKYNTPKEEQLFVYFGVFCFIITFVHGYLFINEYNNLLNILYLLFLIGTILATYPAWQPKFKSKTLIAIIWNLSMLCFILINSILLILSDFNQVQSIILISGLMAMATIFSWQAIIFMMIAGLGLSMSFCKHYYLGSINLSYLQPKILFSLFLLGSVLVAFFKTKQHRSKEIEVRNAYLLEQSNKLHLDLIREKQHKEEFINRLDTECIDVFLSTYDQIINLEEKIKNQNNKGEIPIDLIKIVNKLKAGANYLNEVINIVRNKININPQKVAFKQFLYSVIENYKNLNNYQDLQILINYKSNLNEIEIDQNLIQKVLINCIDSIINKNNSANNLNIIVEDTEIEYVNYEDPLKIKRDGVKLSLLFDNHIDKQQSNQLDPIKLSENYKIIIAHYGKIQNILDLSNHIVYYITIPSRLKEIRPPKALHQDHEFSKIIAINDLIGRRIKEIINDIAKQLIELSVDPSLIIKVTKLTADEINLLRI